MNPHSLRVADSMDWHACQVSTDSVSDNPGPSR